MECQVVTGTSWTCCTPWALHSILYCKEISALHRVLEPDCKRERRFLYCSFDFKIECLFRLLSPFAAGAFIRGTGLASYGAPRHDSKPPQVMHMHFVSRVSRDDMVGFVGRLRWGGRFGLLP